MNRPRYEQHCANACLTRKGEPVIGTQWIHLYGQTKWVCGACAAKAGKLMGLEQRTREEKVPDRNFPDSSDAGCP